MKLIEWLRDTKITIKTFSMMLGVHKSYIYYLMNGKRRSSERLLKRIAELTRKDVSKPEDLKG